MCVHHNRDAIGQIFAKPIAKMLDSDKVMVGLSYKVNSWG